MKATHPAQPDSSPYDVVICGGGLAGLTLAMQLRRELPQAVVTVLEKSTRPLPDACHKVGESSVEVAMHYWERLGLYGYMRERQLLKWGLRFYPGGGELPLHLRTEIGPFAEPPLKTYQLDRGRLESDLRGMVERDGATLIEGAKVTGVEIGTAGARHTVRYERDGVAHELQPRWVVDATGWQGFLRKKLKLTRTSPHVASSGWYRIEGKFDINDMVPASEVAWHNRPCAKMRWLSTNHFMGEGYWVWVIPLSSGMTSIGAVIHEDTHDPRVIAGLEATQAFIKKHEPHLYAAIEKYPVKDFLCLRNYAHGSGRGWSEDRWATVGPANGFSDPLYSPGSDLIAFANCFTLEMMRTDLAGGDMKEKATMLSAQFRAILTGSTQAYTWASPAMGHPSAFAYKVFFNNFAYWSFTCQYYKQEMCRHDNKIQERLGTYGGRFLELFKNVEIMLAKWARIAPEPQAPVFKGAPAYPSILIDAHVATAHSMTIEESFVYFEMRVAQAEEIVAELVMRIVMELGPDRAPQWLDDIEFDKWNITITKQRVDIERLSPAERLRVLPTIASDVERGLLEVRPHPQAIQALEQLLQRKAKQSPQQSMSTA
jgi:flavin-dependent dehydrogenase